MTQSPSTAIESDFVRSARPARASLWITAGLAACLGFGAGRLSSAVSRSSAVAPAQARPVDWRARLPDLALTQMDDEERAALARAVTQDAETRRAALARFSHEPDREAQVALREILAQHPSPALAQEALALARSGADAPAAAGLDLLARLPPEAEAFAFASERLRHHVGMGVDVLVGLLLNLRPPSLVTADEARAASAIIQPLLRHADPLVRAHAVQTMTEWDKHGQLAQLVVLGALADAAPLVRKAAVGAVMLGGLRSPNLQQALISLLRRADEDPETQGATLQALERYPLTASDRSLCMRVQARLMGEPAASQATGHD